MGAVRGLALLVTSAAGLMLGGCAALPFGNHELARNNAAAHTAAPMPLEATYSPGTASTQTAALTTEVPAPTLRPDPTTTASLPPATASTPPADDALLSPDEKAKVIAELEALAKKQGDELTKERAAASAACDNLSAADLRKKLLQGSC